MNTDAEARLYRNEIETLNRMACQAEAAGIRIVLQHRMTQHLAIDPTLPVAYAVSADGCTCRQFLIWDRCPHHSLLLSELGLLPSPEEIGWPEELPSVKDGAVDEIVSIVIVKEVMAIGA